MSQSPKARNKAVLALFLGIMAAAASMTRLHSRPAFLAGFAGGVLLILGIYLLAKR